MYTSTIVLVLTLLLASKAVYAQNGEGSLRIEYQSESIEYEDESKAKIVSKSITSHVIDMPTSFLLLRNLKEFEWLVKSPHQSEQAAETILQMSNHKYRGEYGMTWDEKIPIHEIQFKSHSEGYRLNPCADDGSLFQESTYDFEGAVADGTILDLVLSMAGDRTAVRMQSQSRGGKINSRFPFNRRWVEQSSNSDGDCILVGKDEVVEYGLNVNPPKLDTRLNTNEDGYISRLEPAEIPLAVFAKYLEDPSKPQKFISTFSDYSDDGRTVSNTKGTVTIVLGKTASAEIILTLDGNYDKWYPSLDGSLKPSKIGVKAELNDSKAEACKIRLTLGDVSRYPGVATNYPVDGASSLDLYFPKDQPAGIEWVDSATITSSDKVRQIKANISVADYAATAKLYAAALDQSYPSKESYGDLPYLQLPKDRDANSVADSWEASQGVKNLNASSDDDHDPVGQKRAGDGYTLFEEYRGFIVERNSEFDGTHSIVNGRHIRTNPGHKDLFIYDPDELAKLYYEKNNIARLNLHYVTPETMRFNSVARDPRNRVINTNTPREHSYAPQYGLYIVRWTTLMDVGKELEMGQARDVSQVQLLEVAIRENTSFDEQEKKVKGGNYKIKDNYMIRVPANAIQRFFGKKNFEANMRWTLTHEIGHTIGIPHHEPDQMQGVLDCVMRYRADDEKEHGLDVVKTRFCTSQDTYMVNNPELDQFQKQPAHDCFGQIDVKSDP